MTVTSPAPSTTRTWTRTRLFTPGPVEIPHRVLRALSEIPPHHPLPVTYKQSGWAAPTAPITINLPSVNSGIRGTTPMASLPATSAARKSSARSASGITRPA